MLGGDFILRYFQFLKQCCKERFQFFSYPSIEKAKCLAQYHLSFWAGIHYMDCSEYEEAIKAFKEARAPKHLVIAYEKQGYYEQALKLADEKKLYQLGLTISLHIKDLKNAAYFYTYIDMGHAGKLYRDLHCFYEAGYAFLANHDAIDAIDMFRRCPEKKEQLDGFKKVSEYALVLYFKRSYETAFKIFLALDDFCSALECAKCLRQPELVAACHKLIAFDEAGKGNFLFAGQCIQPYDALKASTYYALAGDYDRQINLLLEEDAYEKAMQVCLLHHKLNTAYEIATTYNLDLSISTPA